MKIFKNKFIFVLLIIIGLIFLYEIYTFHFYKDTNSYITLIEGTGTLNDKNLVLREKDKVKVGDIVKSLGDNSIIVLEWGDNSITRLGGNTEIKINKNYVSKDLTKIQISFNLEKGKTWNFLLSLIGKDSYFTEYVDDVEAGVRGTTFEVNKDEDYVYVKEHEVSLLNTKTSKEVLVGENSPISISTFSLLDLQKFLNSIKDSVWEKINEQLDSNLVSSLKSSLKTVSKVDLWDKILGFFSKKQDILNSINSGVDFNSLTKKIDKLSDKQKQEVYDKVFSNYQKYNFLSSTDSDYDTKLYYQEILLKTSYNTENTKILLKNSLYDINNMISSENLENLKDSLNLLIQNKDKIKELNIDFNKYVDLSSVPDSLKESLVNSLEPLKEILNINLNFDDLKNLGNAAKGKINDFLEENLGGLLNNFKKSE